MTALTIEQFLARNRERFGYIHLGMFIAFLALLIIPLFLPVPPEEARPWNNFTLFAKFAVWGVWFPLLLLSVIILGRAWCGILCPQGALSEFLNKRGGSRPLPRWMRWEGTPMMSFILITILGQLIGVREYPKPMLLIFGGTMLLAAVVGYTYTKGRRAWCRHLCPVGLLLGVFSRLGAVGIERITPPPSAPPLNLRGGWGELKTICPTYINLHTKTASRHCLECMRCVNPTPLNPPLAKGGEGGGGTLHIEIRKPGKEIVEVQKREPDIYEVVFLFLATGLALGGFHWLTNPFFVKFKMALGNFFIDRGLGYFIGKSGPWWIMVNYPERGDAFNWLDFISVLSFMTAFMAVLGVTLFCLTVLSSALSIKSPSTSSGRTENTVMLSLSKHESVLEKMAVIGYLYAPVALLSLVLGLGADLFPLLRLTGLGDGLIKGIKFGILSTGAIWSLYLGWRLTKGQILPQIPNVIGVGIVTWAWYAVI